MISHPPTCPSSNPAHPDRPAAASSAGPRRGRIHPGKWLGLSSQTLPLIGLALLPKCPLCLAAYLGFLTVVGVDTVAAAHWTVIVLLGTSSLILVWLLRAWWRARRILPFGCGLVGYALIAAAYFGRVGPAGRWTGVAVFCIGCVLQARQSAAKRHGPQTPRLAPVGVSALARAHNDAPPETNSSSQLHRNSHRIPPPP